MMITLQLEPTVEARLVAEARTQGMPLETYLTTMLARTAAGSWPELTDEDFDAGLDALAEGSENLPILPPEAYHRKNMYRDG